MSDPFIVEIWGQPAGIVLRDAGAWRFHATTRAFFALDGQPFSTPGHARLAAARLHPAPRPAAARSQSCT